MFASPSNGTPNPTATVTDMRPSDSWSTGDPDERYVGQRSRLVADKFLAWPDLPSSCAPGGTVAGYVWNYSGRRSSCAISGTLPSTWTPTCANSMNAVDCGCADRMRWRARFESANLTATQVDPIDVPPRFRDFGDYWTPFRGGQRPAPSYAVSMTDSSRNRFAGSNPRAIAQSRRWIDPTGCPHLGVPGPSPRMTPGLRSQSMARASTQVPVDARRGARPKSFLRETSWAK
jgi:hypothetical protein